jgi:choline monooxygenase
MRDALPDLIRAYNPGLPLAEASSIPAPWYVDARVLELERQSVFAHAWQPAARAEQVSRPGEFVCAELAGGEPVIVIRGADGLLRAFFNVCRHRGAAVLTGPAGSVRTLRCPYHGWTYGLDGALLGAPEFSDVSGFDPSASGLVPLAVEAWEPWVFVRIARAGPPLGEWLGPSLTGQLRELGLPRFSWFEQRRYTLACNWKVFVDNYLDGGYHVPHLHKGLASVLEYREYTIENGERFCLQSSPMVADGADPATGAVRSGDRARYYWVYPGFMVNVYQDAMDVNLVRPIAVDRTAVIFDFYVADASDAAAARNRASIEISERIQQEDEEICASVQRGLASGAYAAGRLSVRREAGQHLFHRLLHADLQAGLADRGR